RSSGERAMANKSPARSRSPAPTRASSSRPTGAALEFDRGSLLLSLPRGARVPRYLAWDERVGAWRTEALNHARLREDAALYRLSLEDRAERFFECPPLRVALPPLRPDQEAAIAAWEQAGRCGVIVKPTGTGKTEIALAIIARHRVSSLIVAPLRDLMYQWQRRVREGLGFDAGVLGDGRREIWPITVTTYDSAWIHMKEMGNRYRLVVFDEAHHLPGASLHESALDCLAPMRLGLTATPARADGRERLLDSLIGPLAFREEIPAAKGRTLADYSLVRVPIHLTPREQAEFDRCSRAVRAYLAERRREDPDFEWTDLARLARTDGDARDTLRAYRRKLAIVHRSAEKLRVVEDVLRLHPDEQCVIFTASNRMALDVSARFLIPALTSHSDKRERNAVLDAFGRGRIRALAACEVLNEGWDAPALKVGVVLGGEKGVKEAVQRIGRLLRRSGDRAARLYEVVVQETPDVTRARRRGRTDAYQAAARLSLGQAKQLDLF
ncbi:MAG TPA: DEAD/DEAH box helicase family protein, partial [Candidatus Methylomirabilis sp.]|nr:DEAD/DEAH box helicase family protein [Candidatus Methylomirabilis sp.]